MEAGGCEAARGTDFMREAQDQKVAGEQAERVVKDMQQVGPISISISFLIPTAELDI